MSPAASYHRLVTMLLFRLRKVEDLRLKVCGYCICVLYYLFIHSFKSIFTSMLMPLLSCSTFMFYIHVHYHLHRNVYHPVYFLLAEFTIMQYIIPYIFYWHNCIVSSLCGIIGPIFVLFSCRNAFNDTRNF